MNQMLKAITINLLRKTCEVICDSLKQYPKDSYIYFMDSVELRLAIQLIKYLKGENECVCCPRKEFLILKHMVLITMDLMEEHELEEQMYLLYCDWSKATFDFYDEIFNKIATFTDVNYIEMDNELTPKLNLDSYRVRNKV